MMSPVKNSQQQYSPMLLSTFLFVLSGPILALLQDTNKKTSPTNTVPIMDFIINVVPFFFITISINLNAFFEISSNNC